LKEEKKIIEQVKVYLIRDLNFTKEEVDEWLENYKKKKEEKVVETSGSDGSWKPRYSDDEEEEDKKKKDKNV